MFDIILRNLTQRKMRTGLTIFGIALGIFAVIVMGSMSENFNQTFERSMSLTADDIRVVAETGAIGGGIAESKVGDVKRVVGVKDAYGVMQMPLKEGSVGFGPGEIVFAAPPEARLKGLTLEKGRFLERGDTYQTYVGSSLARTYNLDVGSKLEIHDKNFTVVGVTEYSGSFFDSVAVVPLKQAQKLYEREGFVMAILAKPDEGVDTEKLAKSIKLNVDGVDVFSPTELRRQVEQSLVIFTVITISAAILAAIIGGLSVMNTMLMSVTERTHEFGILRALGAETRDILLMTVGEASVMGLLGGMLGVALGVLATYYLNAWLITQGVTLFLVTPRLVAIAMLFATLLGMFSGLYPAYRASMMNPVEALRYE